MIRALKGMNVAFLFTEGVEQSELIEPLHAVEAAGAESTLVSLDRGPVQMRHRRERGDRIEAEYAVEEVSAHDFDALVLPGGVANPDRLRTDQDAVEFVRAFFDLGKPVGVICHGPWTLIEADVVRGRTLTSWPSLQTDLRNAGANWVDQEVHVGHGLVSSRRPEDLPAFCRMLVQTLASGVREVDQVA